MKTTLEAWPDPFAGHTLACDEDVPYVGCVFVATFDEHIIGAISGKRRRIRDRVVAFRDQSADLVGIRCQYGSARNEFFFQNIEQIIPGQPATARRNQDWINNDRYAVEVIEGFRNATRDPGGRQQTDLDCRNVEIFDQHIDLVADQCRGHRLDRMDIGRILDRQCSNDGGRMRAVRSDGLDVGRDAGPTGRVVSGNHENDGWGVTHDSSVS